MPGDCTTYATLNELFNVVISPGNRGLCFHLSGGSLGPKLRKFGVFFPQNPKLPTRATYLRRRRKFLKNCLEIREKNFLQMKFFKALRRRRKFWKIVFFKWNFLRGLEVGGWKFGVFFSDPKLPIRPRLLPPLNYKFNQNATVIFQNFWKIISCFEN